MLLLVLIKWTKRTQKNVLQSVLNITFFLSAFNFFLFCYLKEEFEYSNICPYPSLMKKRSGYSNIISTSLALFKRHILFIFLTSYYFYNNLNTDMFSDLHRFRWQNRFTSSVWDRIKLHLPKQQEWKCSKQKELNLAKLVLMRLDCIMYGKATWSSKSLLATLVFYTDRVETQVMRGMIR